MAKTSKRSTSGRKSSAAASGARQTRLGQAITIAVIVVILVAGGYYLFTGLDPLGLLGEEASTPAASATPRAASPTKVGSGGKWWEVYFTDPNTINNPDNLAGSIPEKLIAYINGAQDSIHIAAFEFNLTPVAEALIAAHKRGVDVRWVTDDENGIEADVEEGHGQFAMLKKAGIQVKDDGRGALMHNKFWVFDGKRVWTGSTNVTQNCNFRNNNNVIVIHLPEVAAMFEREFQEMWDGEFGPTSPSTANEQQVTIEGTPLQILFASEDKAISQIIPLIKGAKRSIRFMAFSFTHGDLGAAVLAGARAGVDVQGIFETRGSETEYSQLPPLYCAKVPVRQDGNPGTFHHKVFVIDEQIVVTGSLNFSDNADESNDENVVIVTNKEIAALYLQEFERRWAEATEPKAADMKCK